MAGVSLKHVLSSEILAVTSAMRKNSRWASSSPLVSVPSHTRDSLGSNLGLRISTPMPNSFGSSNLTGRVSAESELMMGFEELKRTIRDVQDITSLPLPTLLNPFFAIIRSPLSTGPITSTALSSLHTFFAAGLISSNAISLDAAMIELSHTISHCKFEASDSSGDEVALLKIMTVIQDCLCSETGRVLGDMEVCEMLETVLTTCCQMRLSEILRRSAENTMQHLVRTVFVRLHELNPEEEEEKVKAFEDEDKEGQINMEATRTDHLARSDVEQLTTDQVPSQPEENGLAESEAAVDSSVEADSGKKSEDQVDPTPPAPVQELEAPPEHAQYGLPSILELLRVLISVLDPGSQQHTDSTRLIALTTLNTAFQSAGSAMSSYPALITLISDQGCKFLFQLARSENLNVLGAALRTIATVLETMRIKLKLQQELFLAFTIDRLAPPALPPGAAAPPNRPAAINGTQRKNSPRPGTPNLSALEPQGLDSAAEKGTATPTRILAAPARGETRDLILETLGQICRHPSFMVDLYTNYDCDINCENVFERLIDFLAKAVYPSHYRTGQGIDAQQRNAQFLCLDLLLAFVNDMAARNEENAVLDKWSDNYPPVHSLLSAKSQKKLTITGATLFNAKPKNGLSFLEENKLIYQEKDLSKEQSLARFLKECTRLDKRLLGDFISKPDNLDILKAFIGLFDFKNKGMAEAMREMLESFRLPGEAQQIARITEIFASTYFASGPDEIRSEDAVYVLAYSIILLNTDLHNPQVRKRMSIEDYQKNLRGVNDKQDFSPEFLQNIYDSIRKREIVMPEEHTGQLGFEYAWKELLTRSRQAGDLMICNTSDFDLEIFKAVWRPVISAIAYAFITFEDDYIIQRAIAGFRQCAILAGTLRLPDVFDFVVVSLSQATSLLEGDLPPLSSSRVPNYPVVEVEGQSITVSSLSVGFGTNFKGQLAAVVLFNIVNGNGNALREGWTQIFEMFQNLFLHSLLPTRMLQMEDFLGGVSMIPLRGNQPPLPAARGDGGLLSALSSYLMTPYAGSDQRVPDATDTDVENTLCTIDCITSCRLDELYSQIMQLDQGPLVAAVKALEALAHERTVARLKQEADDGVTLQDDGSFSLPYDPASVFLLETMVSICCHTPDHIEELWPIVFEHLSSLLSTAAQYSNLLIERAVVGLLRLCQILATKSSLRDQLYVSLDLLAGLPSQIANSVAAQVIAGVILLVKSHKEVISSPTEWNLIFALIQSTLSDPEAARQTFDLLISLTSDGPDQHVSVDNFPGLVTLLDDFASFANFSLEQQQHQPRRPPTSPLPSNPSVVERGQKAVDIVFDLKKFIGPLTQTGSLDKGQAWRQLCLPVLVFLSRQSSNAAREIRQAAIGHLQRFLLGPFIILEESDPAQIEEAFTRVVFPLIHELLRSDVAQRDPKGMPEARLRASALLCKAFMHFELRDNSVELEIQSLWIQVLDALDQLVQMDTSDQLHEAVEESLKNVLLVMNAAGKLVPQSSAEDSRDEKQKALWIATSVRLEKFLPNLLLDAIPSPPPKQPAQQTPESIQEPKAEQGEDDQA